MLEGDDQPTHRSREARPALTIFFPDWRALGVWVALLVHAVSPCWGGGITTSAPTPNGLSSVPGLFVPSSRPGAWVLAGLTYQAEITAGGMVITAAGHRMEVRFEGVSASAVLSPEGPPVVFADFRSRLSASTKRAVPGLMIRGVYPGVDVRLTAPRGALKTEYVVHAGARVDAIRIRYSTAERLSVLRDGALRVDTPDGPWFEQAPSAVQGSALSEESVDVHFLVSKDDTVRFRAAPYDAQRDLIIDPQLTFASLLSGTGMSVATGIKVDSYGNVYIAGYTDATDFAETEPLLSGGGGVDSFLLKLAPGGTQILFLVLIGGSGDDRVNGLALDADGVPCLVGTTISPDFPTANANQTSLQGGRDGFVLKVSPDGTYLLFSTFLGGSGEEWVNAVAIHGDDVWVGGNTTSADFPVVAAYQSTRTGTQNGFVSRFSGNGALLSSTYVGGTGADEVRALVVNSLGEPVIAGSSGSSDLPVAVSAFQTTRRGQQDGFVLRFNSSATAVLGGSYLGGSLGDTATPEAVQGIAVAVDGSYWVGGFTPSLDFPMVNPWNSTVAPGQTGFIARFSSDFSSLVWSTMVGGASNSLVDALQADASGGVYVSGKTSASDFPLVGSLQSCPAGAQDGILIHYAWGANSPDLSTCYGGSANEEIRALAVHPNGRVYFAGSSGSADAVRVNAIETPSGGAIWAVVGELMTSVRNAVPSSVSPNAATGANQTFHFNFTHADGAQYIRKVYGLINTNQSQANGCALTYDAVNNLMSLANDAGTFPSGAAPGSFLTLSNHQCSVDLSTAGVVLSGTTLQLSATVTFAAAFAVNATIWGQAADTSNSSSGWVTLGTVRTVTNHAPAVSSFSMQTNGSTSSSGSHAVLSFSLSDADGAADMTGMSLVINSTFGAAHACMVSVTSGDSRVWLQGDSGSTFDSLLIASGGTLANSQCSVNVSSSSSSLSGNSWSVRLDVQFSANWPGAKTMWLSLTDQTKQFNYAVVGSFTVQVMNYPPVLQSFGPSSASGRHQTFTVTMADLDGPADFGWIAMIINQTFSVSQGCYISAVPSTGLFWVYNDEQNLYLPAAAGSSGTIGNSRCTLLLATSTMQVSGTTFTATVDVVFSSGWPGAKNVYVDASDRTSETGWMLKGTYTVSAGRMDPVALPVGFTTSPSRTQRLSMDAFDGDGDLSWLGILVAPSFSTVNSCLFTADTVSHMFWLLNDQGTAWLSGRPGASGRLQNSQCSLDLQNSTMEINGNILSATAAIEFNSAWAGAKQVFGLAVDQVSSSPWVQWGTLTVSSANLAPVIQSVTPASSVGLRQSLTMTIHDGDGASDFRWGAFLINSTFSTDHGCVVTVDPVSRLMWLMTDNGGWLSASLSSNTVLSNQQCSVYANTSSAVISGQTMTLVVDVQFNAAWSGVKSVFATVNDSVRMTPWAPAAQIVVPGSGISTTAGSQIIAVSPVSNYALRQVFGASISDPRGAGDLRSFQFAVADPAGPARCSLSFDAASRSLRLADDGGNWGGAATLGSSGTLHNSVCTVHLANSSWSASGTVASVLADVEFSASWTGLRVVSAGLSDSTSTLSPFPVAQFAVATSPPW